MMIKIITTSVLAIALMGEQANAFWRMPCSRSGLARIDPLISPGEISGHVHTIHGSSGFGPSSEFSDLRAGNCTSCEVAEDKSAYWTPPPYFKNSATGEFSIVNQVGGMLAYYLLYPNADNTSLSAFPEGFSMVAGNNAQRNFTLPVPDPPKSLWGELGQDTQEDRQAKALGFNCLNYNNVSATEGSLYRHFLPDKAFLDANCPDGVRFELMFPSCWDGVNANTTDNSHVAYPDLVMTGTCPDDYPIRLPSLFYETIWDTSKFVNETGEFVISNGDPLGYGYHGDFIMGWDPEFLQQAVDTCTNLSGEIGDCPLFTIQDADVYNSCNITIPEDLVEEAVLGPLSYLPGKVAIQSGPALAIDGLTIGASGISLATSTGNVVPTLPVSPGTTITAAANQTYVPGGVLDAIALTTPTSTSSSTPTSTIQSTTLATSSSTITAAPAISSAVSSDAFYSTEYTTSGKAAIEIFWVEEVVTVTASPSASVAARDVHEGHAAKHIKHLRANKHHL